MSHATTSKPTVTSQTPDAIAADGRSKAGRSPTPRALKTCLLLAVLPLVLLPLTAASLYSAIVTQQRDKAAAILRLDEYSTTAGSTAASFLDEGFETARSLALVPTVVEAARSSSQLVREQGLTPLDRPTQEQRLAVQPFQERPQLSAYLQAIADRRDLRAISLWERHGLNFAATPPSSNVVQFDEIWWQMARDRLRSGGSDYDVAVMDGAIAFSEAIVAPDSNEFWGAVKVELNTERLEARVRYLIGELQGTTQVQLLDTEGNSSGKAIFTLSAEDRPPELSGAIGGETLLAIGTHLVELARTMTDAPDTDDFREKFNLDRAQLDLSPTASGDFGVSAHFQWNGRDYCLTTIPHTRWIVAASIDSREIEAAANRQRNFLLLFDVAIGAIAIFVTLKVARQLCDPLDRVSQAAENVRRGRLDIFVPPQGTVETHALANNFNALLAQIRTLLDREHQETERALHLSAIAGVRHEDDLQASLTPYLERVRQALDLDRIFVYHFRANGISNIAAESLGGDWTSVFSDEIDTDSLCTHLLEAYWQGRASPLSGEGTTLDPECHELRARLQVRSDLVIPIAAADRWFGLLVVHQCRSNRPWKAIERDRLSKEAQQLGLALSGLVLLEQQQASIEEQRQQREVLEWEILQLMNQMEPATDGNLTIRAPLVEGDIGILGDMFNVVIENLQIVAKQVQLAARHASHALSENRKSMETLADSASIETEAIQRALSSVEEMTNQLHRERDRARQVAAALDIAFLAVADDKSSRPVLEQLQVSCQAIDSLVETIGIQAGACEDIAVLMRQASRASEVRSDASRQVADAVLEATQVAQTLQASVAQFQVEKLDSALSNQ